MQVHAPLQIKSAPERILLVFVCTSEACSGSPHAFVAIRCQKAPAAEHHEPQQQADGGHARWGTVTWGATGAASAQPAQDAVLDFGDLLADMDKLALRSAPVAQPAAAAPQPPAELGGPPSAPAQDSIICENSAVVLPEFWIGFRRVDAAQAAGRSEEAHVRQLLQEYQLSAASTADSSCATAAAGEHYEKTDPHTKFLEKLARHPHQCVRYGANHAAA